MPRGQGKAMKLATHLHDTEDEYGCGEPHDEREKQGDDPKYSLALKCPSEHHVPQHLGKLRMGQG